MAEQKRNSADIDDATAGGEAAGEEAGGLGYRLKGW